MNLERWRIEEIYHSAAEIEHARRGDFLAGTCNGDEELRRELEAMLAARFDSRFPRPKRMDRGERSSGHADHRYSWLQAWSIRDFQSP